MAKFSTNYTYRTPLRTIEFRAGQETVDADVIKAAELAGVLEVKQDGDGDENRPSKGSKARGIINLKG